MMHYKLSHGPVRDVATLAEWGSNTELRNVTSITSDGRKSHRIASRKVLGPRGSGPLGCMRVAPELHLEKYGLWDSAMSTKGTRMIMSEAA